MYFGIDVYEKVLREIYLEGKDSEEVCKKYEVPEKEIIDIIYYENWEGMNEKLIEKLKERRKEMMGE
jgi:hypothetical protein